MAKAKTPSTGGDKSPRTATSRATYAAAKAKATSAQAPKTPKRPAKSNPAKVSSAKSDAKTSSEAKPAQDISTTASSGAAPAKAVAPVVKAEPAALAKSGANVGSGAIETEAGKKPATVDTAASPKSAEAAKTEKPTVPEAAQKPERASERAPAKPIPPAPEKRGSVFWPMVFGGVIAGGIGFVAAELNVLGIRSDADIERSLRTDLAAQDARLVELEQAAAGATSAPDTSDALNEIKASITDLASRIDEVANRPAPVVGEAPAVDTSGFEAELATLKSSVETQRDEIQRLLDNAISVEEATSQAAETANLQSALARIVSAIDTGQPFTNEVAELQTNGIADIPEALSNNAETGVVTSANLQDRFPAVARSALAAARTGEPANDGGGFGSFLKRQLGARSVAPREGTDPDAVLSRAEAAVRDGRLADALAESSALPEAAQAEMSDWLSEARARQATQDAVQTLTQRLTAN